MRLLLASVAALAAVTLAVPSFAQEVPATPTPAAKPKPGTAAYCNTLKSATSKNACLKRVHAQATPAKAPMTAAATPKSKAKKLTPPADSSAQLTAPASTPAATPGPAPSQTITVPPLPQKTI
jgi:hypothetical protein